MISAKISVSVLLALVQVGSARNLKVMPHTKKFLRGVKARRLDSDGHLPPTVSVSIDGDVCPGDVISGTMTVQGAGGTSSTTKPMDVVLSIDTSGSMEGSPIDEAKGAAMNFVDQMAAVTGSMAGVVGWDEDIHTSLPLTNTDPPGDQVVKATINGLTADDPWAMTDLNDGILGAIQIHDATPRDPADPSSKAILLLTDGFSNTPEYVTCADGGQAAVARDRGLPIYAIGFGPYADSAALNDMADCTGGQAYLEVEPGTLQAVFDEILETIFLSSVPHNINVELVAADGIENLRFVNDPHIDPANPALVVQIDDTDFDGQGDGLSAQDDPYTVDFEATIPLDALPTALLDITGSFVEATDWNSDVVARYLLDDEVSFTIERLKCCLNHPCGNNDKKVNVCHIPPENPANKHNICISPNALPDHLEQDHEDYCGDCLV